MSPLIFVVAYKGLKYLFETALRSSVLEIASEELEFKNISIDLIRIARTEILTGLSDQI